MDVVQYFHFVFVASQERIPSEANSAVIINKYANRTNFHIVFGTWSAQSHTGWRNVHISMTVILVKIVSEIY